jgi:PAS domain S-box-containing protein
MQNSGSNKSHLKRSKTSLHRKKKSERTDSDAPEQIKPDDQDNKQEEMYKTLIENIPCAVYSASPGERGPTTFMSKNWKDWTGYSAEEFYQDPEAWSKCIYPDDREKAINAYIEACKNEAPYNLEYRIVHRDTGQIRYVRDEGILTKDAKDLLIRVDGIITDITEVKTSEDELAKYRDQLEELVKERTAELEKANEVLKLQKKESQKAAEALRESENRYKAVVENAAEGIVVVQDRMLKFVNPAVRAIMGYTEEELMSKSFIEFIHPDHREQVVDIHLKRNKGEEVPPVYEVRISNKQGETKYMENNGILIEWEGRPATLNFLRDITERKKAEEELKKHQYYLEKAQDIGKIGTWELEIEKNILVWTDENYRIFGIPKGTELTYEIFLDSIYPDDREYVDKKWKAALNKEPYDIEHRIIVDGEVRWVREKAELDFDDEGNCTHGIGFTQDITDRKQTEGALAASELKYRSLFDNSIEGIGLSMGNRVISVNKALLDIFGYDSIEELTKIPILDHVAPESREMIRGFMEKAKKGDVLPARFEYKIICKNGLIKDIEISTVKVSIEGQKYTQSTFRDITERKKAEEQLLDYQAKLKSLASQLSITEESERRRIATELHDQIGQSLVFSKLKLDELHHSATSNELTKALDEICNNIGQVIQDTRTLTFDLSSPILNELGLEAAVAEWLDVQIRAKYGIETEFEDDGQQKPLDDDIRVFLFRNVRELLVNVIKHAQANKVKVSIRRVNEHIGIDVEDDGKGFDSVQVTSRAAKDTKFGLFSIRERLEYLGGSFETISEPGRGSKITMTAPLKLTRSQS